MYQSSLVQGERTRYQRLPLVSASPIIFPPCPASPAPMPPSTASLGSFEAVVFKEKNLSKNKLREIQKTLWLFQFLEIFIFLSMLWQFYYIFSKFTVTRCSPDKLITFQAFYHINKISPLESKISSTS